jgi:TetR/AcrR family transcriptional regulator
MAEDTGPGASAKKRGPYRSSELVRSKLIDAAMVEFASHGFEGASTRAIARRAGAHQPQINYHFESKTALWYAVMDQMMSEVDDHTASTPTEDPRSAVEAAVRGLVRFAAARPELNRMMIQEASSPSDRLDWLVDTHVRPRFKTFQLGWKAMRAQGQGRDVPPELVYHLLVGAASLLHANAPEVELLTGLTPGHPEVIDAHADAMVHLFLGEI